MAHVCKKEPVCALSGVTYNINWISHFRLTFISI